jgi:hypothetical protein
VYSEFVAALYVTNYLRTKTKTNKTTMMLISPVDAFLQVDEDRDGKINFFEFEKALFLLNHKNVISPNNYHPKKSSIKFNFFSKNKNFITIDEFKQVWLELIDIKEELRKRGINPSSYTIMKNKSTSPPPLGIFRRMSKKMMMMIEGEDYRTCMQQFLLDLINQEEKEEIEEAMKAKKIIQEMENLQKIQEQKKKRDFFHAQIQMETKTRTEEALKERQQKIIRKKERFLHEKFLKKEKNLLVKIQKQQEIRKKHEIQIVQENIQSKIEKNTLKIAKTKKDILDLSCQQIKNFPFDLYHGKEQRKNLSNLLILNLSKNQLNTIPAEIFHHLFILQQLDLSENQLIDLPVSAVCLSFFFFIYLCIYFFFFFFVCSFYLLIN